MAEAGIGLLDSISEFCRRAGMAESTFGRRAVNDGKFVARLRDGARITPETLERVSAYLSSRGIEAPATPRELKPLLRVAPAQIAPSRGRTEPPAGRTARATSASSTTGRSTCCSSTPAARRR